ncbi:Casein kinase I [Strongyloides ratti]|uniref:non-specific serine/threonine protein kinase n=1 Tax=Strongyloides ratti TaxID=34506 RepID=A0A090MXY5_STRRB|nr:Casein kinase I [Strongyloides ratti]CEF66244.1 Casein kinase I [Strongyloides ratti]
MDVINNSCNEMSQQNCTIVYNNNNYPQWVDNWQIVDFINSGTFGKIFHVINSYTNVVGAMKIEYVGVEFPLLTNEINHIIYIQNILINDYNFKNSLRYLPHIFDRGSYADGSVFCVMELLGPDLLQLKNQQTSCQFTLWTSYWLLREMIRAIRGVHYCGFVHRDIKLANFCIRKECNEKRSLVLIDFGLISQDSSCFPNYFDNLKGKTVGTLCYSSCQSQLSKAKPTFVDDLWSIFYVSLENFTGTLPWKTSNDKNLVYNMKINLNLINLQNSGCHIPHVMHEIYCLLLNPLEHKRLYLHDKILSLIDEELRILEFHDTLLLDWE